METNVSIKGEMEGKKPSLLGIVTSPSIQFARMKAKAPVGVPLVLILLVMAIMTVLVTYLTLHNPLIQAANAKAYAQTGFKMSLGAQLASGAVGGLIGGAAGLLITAAFFKLCMIFMGNDTPYKKILSITIYAYVIPLLGMLVNALIALALKGYEVNYTSLAPLFTGNNMLHAIAMHFDIFQFWYLVVLGMGLHITAGLSKNKAITLVVIIFLISVGFSAISGTFQTAGM